MPPKKYTKSAGSSNAKSVKPMFHYVANYANATHLIIVESPSKCAKIEQFLGDQYRCIASRGHIRCLGSLKNIDVASGKYTPTFTVLKDKAEWVKEMGDVIRAFPKENVIIASDDDREGEAIAAHICAVFGLSLVATRRVLFREITESAVRKAVLTDPPTTRINMPLVYSQYARQVLDVLVGFRISPLLWRHIYHSKSNSLSAGRCQTPALRLVYDNHCLGKTKVAEYNYKVLGVFLPPPYSLDFVLDKQFSKTDDVEAFLGECSASSISAFAIHLGEKRESVKSPPTPFNTSNLLQSASNSLGLSPKHTMSLLQILYQDGHITYIRTENTRFAKEFLAEAATFITTKYGGPNTLGDFANIENIDNSNPHEAIRPTHIEAANIVAEDTKLVAVYRLIWRTTIESCMSPAKYNCYKLTIPAPQSWQFHHSLEIPTFLGWKTVGKDLAKTTNEMSADPSKTLFYIQSLKKSTVGSAKVQYQSISTIMTVSNTHSHYSEAGLISKLEEFGIGRPSTFALLVDTIIERGYVSKEDVAGTPIECTEYELSLKNGNKIEHNTTTKIFGNEKNKLVLQPIGELCICFLTEHFQSVFDYTYTKDLEEQLDQISLKTAENAERDWSNLCADVDTVLKSHITIAKKLDKQCYPLVGDTHEFIFTQYGGSIRNIKPKTCDETDETDEVANPIFEYEYIQVDKSVIIDLEKLKRGEYTKDELMDKGAQCLGKHKDHDIYLKNGPYGYYLEWNQTKLSLKNTAETKPQISLVVSLESAILLLDPIISDSTDNLATGIIRNISPTCSIRRGKFGPYIHHFPPGAKKPAFYGIKKFKEDYTKCDVAHLLAWVNKTHNVQLTM